MTKRTYKLYIAVDRAGKYRWRIVAPNGEIVAASGESFASRGNAIRAARRLRVIAADAVLVR